MRTVKSERVIPTPKAQRILDEVTSLTVLDAVWLARELSRLLERPDDGLAAAGVREPRPPRPRIGSAFGALVPIVNPDPNGW